MLLSKLLVTLKLPMSKHSTTPELHKWACLHKSIGLTLRYGPFSSLLDHWSRSHPLRVIMSHSNTPDMGLLGASKIVNNQIQQLLRDVKERLAELASTSEDVTAMDAMINGVSEVLDSHIDGFSDASKHLITMNTKVENMDTKIDKMSKEVSSLRQELGSVTFNDNSYTLIAIEITDTPMEMHKVFREWGASIESYDCIGSLWPLLQI